MSLGIKLSQRAQLRSIGAHGLSQIPREPLTVLRHLPIDRDKRTPQRYLSQVRLQSTRKSDAHEAAVTSSSDLPSDRQQSGPVEYRPLGVPVEQHERRESILVEPFREYPNRRQTHRSKQRHHKSVTAQLRLDLIRLAKRAPVPDWRAVLQYLTAATPEPSVEHPESSVKLVIREESARHLLLDLDDLLWDIRSTTGCTIQTSREVVGDGSLQLLVSGPQAAVEEAVADVLHVVKKATLINLANGYELDVPGAEAADPRDRSDSPRHEFPLSLLKDRRRGFPMPHDLNVIASDVPKPTEWNKASFEQYVISLTNSRMTPQLASKLYPTGTTHDAAVIDQLHAIFGDENTRSAISTSAFKTALAFISRKGASHRPHARALFVRMVMFGMKMDTEVFNILAESMVKTTDLRNFQATLRFMIRRGHQPNLDTWILFLRIIKSEEVKRHIIQVMNNKGLLATPATVRLVAREIVAHDIENAIQQGKDIKAFLTDRSSLYGPGWLSRTSGNKILDVLGRYGKFAECGELIEAMMATRKASPDVVTLNTVLTHCKVLNDIRSAINFLERLEARGYASLDSITLHLLFEMATRRKLPHTMGMVWRYASFADLTSYRMRRRVAQLVFSRHRRARFTKHLIGNADKRLSPESIIDQSLFGEQATASGIRKFVMDMQARDLAAKVKWNRPQYRNWEPNERLGVLLGRAFERDLKLLEDVREGKEVSFEPLALPIKVRARPRLRPGRDGRDSRNDEIGEDGQDELEGRAI